MLRFSLRASTILLLKSLTLIALVAAATIVMTPKNLTGEKGTQLRITNKLLSTDKGFSKASSAMSASGTTCANNVTFTGSSATANTAVTAGDFVYDVQINTTGTASPSTCYTVSLVLTSSGGTQTSYGTLWVATGPSPVSGQTIDCKFDILLTNPPASPFSFKVTVQ